MRILPTLLAAAVIAAFGFTGPAYAGIEVEKAITGIDSNNDSTFDITDPTDITDFLADVPSGTIINFEVQITVRSIDDQDLTGVVVTDRFGAELSVVSTDVPAGTTLQLTTIGSSNKVKLRWVVGSLGTGEETLTLVATTDQDPGGFQEYTECGEHEFNSGPTAKGRVVKANGKGTRQVSDDGDQILLTVSGDAFPECSNCADDDADGFVDFPADLGCTSAEEDDELPFNV